LRCAAVTGARERTPAPATFIEYAQAVVAVDVPQYTGDAIRVVPAIQTDAPGT